MQSKYPLLALYLPYMRYTGTRGFFFIEIWKYPGGRYLYFWSDFLRGGWGVSLVPVPLFFSVESENTVQIVLNCFVLTLSAVYWYAVAKIQENRNFSDPYFLYLLSNFNFF